MMHGPGIVTLLDNGMLYEGWESVQVTRSVKQMAGQFSLKVSERWIGGTDGPASLLSWRIRPGDACVVAYDGLPVITGYVDAYNPKYAAASHEVMIQGRSKTGDLCDCSAEADMPTGEQRDVTLDQAARKLASKYGIGVKVRADTREKFDVMRAHPGETVHELLERYARPASVALTDDEQGNLVLLQVQDGAGGARLIEGVNILEASAILRADNRYSDYEVKGQDHGTDQEYGKPVAQRSAKAEDGAVKRHRPFRLLNETKTGSGHSKSRAAWEAAARAGESVRVEVKVVGWTQAPGKLWTPGEIATVVSPMLALERSLAIETVRFAQDQGGTITTLSLVPPEALNPKSGAGDGGKSDGQWTATKPAAAPVVTNPMPGILVQR